MTTLAEIGRAAGVSAATVSAVLNPSQQTSRVSPATAERIRTLAATLGYIPNHAARVLKRGRADAIAVTIGTAEAPILEGAYHSTLLAGLEAVIRQAGSTAVLVGPAQVDGKKHSEAYERTLHGLRAGQFDAAIVLCGRMDPLDAPGLPVVTLTQHDAMHVTAVSWDEDAALELILEHLAALGHRRILWLGPEKDAAGNDRGARCAQVAWKREITGEQCRFPLDGTPHLEAAQQALAKRLAAGPPTWTAVACFNDQVAIGAQRALLAAGIRVPADVSVTGIDDLESRFATPAITTVSHRLVDMGRRAGELALQLAAGKTPTQRRHVIAPQLIVRDSTGPVAQKS